MPVLRRAVWEVFAQLVAKGVAECEAYRQAYGHEKITRTAHANASRLMLGNADVRARISELKEEGARNCTFTIEERLQILSDIARDPESERRDRINSITQFTRIKGDGAADRVEHTVSNDLAQAIAFLRSGERPAIEAHAEVMQLPDAQADTQ